MNKVSFIEGSSYYVGDCIEAMQDMKKKKHQGGFNCYKSTL